MVKIHLENGLKFICSRKRGVNWKEPGNVILLRSLEERGLFSPANRRVMITPYALEEEEPLFKLHLWHKNIDINWLRMHSGRKLEEVSSHQRCKAQRQPANRERGG